jgi:hypothetical protein
MWLVGKEVLVKQCGGTRRFVLGTFFEGMVRGFTKQAATEARGKCAHKVRERIHRKNRGLGPEERNKELEFALIDEGCHSLANKSGVER